MKAGLPLGRFGLPGEVAPTAVLLASDPGDKARKTLEDQKFAPEELHVAGRELYIYFPDGMGKSKLPWPRMYKILNTPGTGRNWTSVTKMLEMAENLELS